ncbi:MAG: sulfatase-like hydrolase/transferase [Deltaproteobacteria bacterium]|nr:sulfatase-like hydrolase/transferase [Deltaproteobacteria bacterium]
MPYLKTITAWWAVVALTTFVLAAPADAAAMFGAGASASAAAGVASVHLALALLVGAFWALPLSWADRLVGRLADRPRLQRWIVPSLVGASLFGGAWLVVDPLRHRAWIAYLAAVLMASAAAAGCAWITRADTDTPAARPIVCFSVAVVAMLVDGAILASTYFEFHATLHLLTYVAVLCGCDEIRGRIARRAAPRHAILLGVAATAAIAHLAFVDSVFPGWRSLSLPNTRWLATATHVLRKGIDLDRDGFSAVAWGTDCDDLDPSRHPLAVDRPGGGDMNCNDVDPPQNPTPEDRGLTPGRGAPALSSESVDLMILLTIDALRADCLTEELMPATRGLARRGIRFETVYAASSTSIRSIPLMLMADERSEPIPTQLRSEGVVVRAFASGNGNIDYDALGFPGLTDDHPGCHSIVDAALAEIGGHRGGPLFLWLYCFDPHEPYTLRKPHARAADRVAHGCGTNVAPERSRAYRSEVAAVDAAIGRLLRGLAAARRMERAALIVKGDHGELFGEHGAFTHARSAWEPVLRVPAVFVAPGVPPTVYVHVVTHRDIPATVLGVLGFGPRARKAETFGRSWTRIASDPDYRIHDFVVSRTSYWASGAESLYPLGVIADGHFKLVASFEEGTYQLHDVRADPAERHNLRSADPRRVDRMRRQLAVHGDLDQYPASPPLRWMRAAR